MKSNFSIHISYFLDISYKKPYDINKILANFCDILRLSILGLMCCSMNAQEPLPIDLSLEDLEPLPPAYSLYQPIVLGTGGYGAFLIGYSQNHISTPAIALKISVDSTMRVSSALQREALGVHFGLERGLVWRNSMVGAFIGGTAAQDYSLHFGLRASYLIARYVIPALSIGYMVQHLPLPFDTQQYNLQGVALSGGVFVNMFRGFGVRFDGIYMPHLQMLRNIHATRHENPTFWGYSFIVSFAFYDFSI